MKFANVREQDITSYQEKTQHDKFLSEIQVKKQAQIEMCKKKIKQTKPTPLIGKGPYEMMMS